MLFEYCKKCDILTKFDECGRNNFCLGYSTYSCCSCVGSKIAQCNGCSKVYSISNFTFTNIKNHVAKCVDSNMINESHSDTRESQEEDHQEDDTSINSNTSTGSICTQVSVSSSLVYSDMDCDISNDEINHLSTTVNTLTVSSSALDFGNSVSNNYFRQEYQMYHDHREDFGGIRGLCWRSRNRLALYQHSCLATMDDTEFMFDITKLLTTNTESTNNLQYKVWNEIKHRSTGDFDTTNSGIRLPDSKINACRDFLGGQYGIFNNLPSPNTHIIGDHACMKISDVLKQHLALGRKIMYTESPSTNPNNPGTRIYNGIHGCEATDDLIQSMKAYPNSENQGIHYAWLTTWSDSFLRSYVKQKSNNVWMYTITLPDPDGNSISTLHTYCVAVGAGSLDHTIVIDWYANELENLMKGYDYYCGFKKEIIHLRIGVVAAMADRPEKAFTLKTSLLGDYGKIASWAADIDPEVLPDCKKCFQKRLEAVLKDCNSNFSIPRCRQCCQWNLLSDSVSRKRVLVPKNYPTTKHHDSPDAPIGRQVGIQYIVPVHQTFQWLILAVRFAVHNVSAGVWNKGVMEAFLRTCSIATSVRNNIWMKCRPKNNVQQDVVENGDDTEINDGYEPCVDDDDENGTIPKIWKSMLQMNAYIDCAMHLLFHGIVAYSVERIDEFMKDHSLTPKFEGIVNKYMTDIMCLRLEWCKIKLFPKTQWLAENELGLARILPFVYGLFFIHCDLPERSNTSNQTKFAVMQMFQAMFVMISILMSPRNLLAPMIDEHVKIFLSTCHRYYRGYFEKEGIPYWARTGNFPTLLCLAKQRERFGPVRLYWEGTSERYIQELKKHLVSMRKTPDYFEGKLRLMFKTNVMNWVMDCMSQSKNNQDSESTDRDYRMYYQYNSLEEITEKLQSGGVLSGFTLNGLDGKIVVAYGGQRRSGIMNCVTISRINRGHFKKILGLAFVSCTVDAQSKHLRNMNIEEVEKMIAHHCLILPLVEKDGYHGENAIIYDDWDVGNEFFLKCLPVLCFLLFQTEVSV